MRRELRALWGELHAISAVESVVHVFPAAYSPPTFGVSPLRTAVVTRRRCASVFVDVFVRALEVDRVCLWRVDVHGLRVRRP
jgi:hypothetical protein